MRGFNVQDFAGFLFPMIGKNGIEVFVQFACRVIRHIEQCCVCVRSQPGKYDDAVVGNIKDNNYFIRGGKSVNAEGKTILSADYQTLALPDPLLRHADGSFATGDFLNRR